MVSVPFLSLVFHHLYLHNAWLIAIGAQHMYGMNECVQDSSFHKRVPFFVINFLEYFTFPDGQKACPVLKTVPEYDIPILFT